MIPTSKLRSSTRMTVSEIPSIAIDPFGATQARTAAGRENRISQATPLRTMSMTSATASTCPSTRCPPSRPPKARERSRFTEAPEAARPRVV